MLLAATLARSATAAAARRWCWRRRTAGRGPQNFRAPAAGHFSRAFGAHQSRHRLSGAHYGVAHRRWTKAFFAFLLRACTWSEGSERDKIFLLHQSIDLDELYPTVRVSQIVTRRKYFFLKLRLHVWCTHSALSLAAHADRGRWTAGQSMRFSIANGLVFHGAAAPAGRQHTVRSCRDVGS